METIKMILEVWGVLAVLAGGVWLIDKADKRLRRSGDGAAAESGHSSPAALVIGAIFVTLVFGLAVRIGSGLATTLLQ